MKDRHRKLLGRAAMIAAGLFVVYLLADFAVLGPLAEKSDRIQRLSGEVSDLQRRNHRETRYLAMLRKHAAKTYGADPITVSEQIRVRLDKMVELSGLHRDGTAQPVTGQADPNSFREIGWSVDLAGRLEQVVNMLYLLNKDPYLHRIEALRIVPQRDGRTVELSFRYMTIVIDEKLLTLKRQVGNVTDTIVIPTAAEDSLPLPSLAQNADRSAYGLISVRNIFRPYIKKPPPPAPQPPRRDPPAVATAPPAQATAPDASRFKLVSLTQWGREQDISVKDMKTGEIRRYNLGDPLAGGQIVMVDYRNMPKPENPELLSPSRLIVRLGEDYFAVELGATLAQKHRLDKNQLPSDLKTE